MSAVATPARLEWAGRGVSPNDIADRLAAQRRPADGGAPLTLSGVLNLVAAAGDPHEAGEMREIVEHLADHQPSRAVVLRHEPGGEGLDAVVATSCREEGEHRGVALETVVLTVHGGAGAAAASAVAPLLRSDLPTVLWWPGAPGGESQDDLDALATVADRVVTESGRAPIAATAVRALAGWVPAAAPAVTDLSWAAITGWRQLIAQMVEGEALEALRATDSEAVVAHASPEPCADSLLLAAWLTEVAGPRLIARTEARDDGGGGGIVACELTSGRGRRLAVERAPGRHAAAVIVTEPDGSSRRRVLPLPRPDRAELLAGELELQRRDRRFEETLAAAARGGLL